MCTAEQRRWLLILFLVVAGFASLVAGGHSYAIDNEVQFQTTRSLVRLQDELESVDVNWAGHGPYLESDDGGYVAVVGIGHSIVAAPFYATSRAVAQLLPASDRDAFVRTGTGFTNPVVLGAIAVAAALLALELTRSFRASWLVGLAYALGTYALPHSRTFFTELSSALAITVAVLAAVRSARGRPASAAAVAGFATGFGVLTRASSALFVPVLAVWLLLVVARRRGWGASARGLVAFCAGGVVPLATFLLCNWWRFGSPTDVGYQEFPQAFPVEQGLYNHFFTPGKSMFLFAPIIVLGLSGLAVALWRRNATAVLLAALIAVNLIFFSRLPIWAGDAAWGARYQQIVLPLMCVPAVFLCHRRWWSRSFGVLAGVGFLVPALLGTLVYFNVWFARSIDAGGGLDAVTEEIAWQPFLGHMELVPVAIRDVLDANRPDELERPPYSVESTTHYGFFAAEPRIDFWWLWVAPMKASPVTYVFFVPIAAAFGGALALARARTDRMRSVRALVPKQLRTDPVDA